MIVCDASIVVALLAGDPTAERALGDRLRTRGAALAPVTVTEVLSGRRTQEQTARGLEAFRILATRDGYWERAGVLRRTLLNAGRKAALGDVLTAQACLDHDLPLLTRDGDFRVFAELSGLKLV